MIWFRKDDCILGYIPILFRDYTEEEIREMRLIDKEVTVLSDFIMQIQGIEYSIIGNLNWANCTKRPASRLIDVHFYFNFEFLDQSFDYPFLPFYIKEMYIKQIYDFFKNLRLYKIVSYTEDEISSCFAKSMIYLEPLISQKSLDSIKEDFQYVYYISKETSSNLKKVKDYLENYALHLNDDIFFSTNFENFQIISKRAYEPRNIKHLDFEYVN